MGRKNLGRVKGKATKGKKEGGQERGIERGLLGEWKGGGCEGFLLWLEMGGGEVSSRADGEESKL